jgi:4-amino-4-deoxy-L-arabinose transferase-like glycosyltransferase
MVERQPRFDEVFYIGHAIRLSQGEGYVDETKKQVAFWPVGYPLCLAATYRLTGTGLAAGLGLQISIGTLTCLLLYLLGKRTFGTLIARVASLLLAIYPNHILFSTLHLTEPLFTVLLLGACALLIRSLNNGSWESIGAGILLGLATLTRPAFFLFPLLLPFWYVGQGWRWRHAFVTSLLVFCSTLATLSPWLIRNHQISGRWTDVSTSGGYNFWLGNNPLAWGGYSRPENIEAPLWDGTKYDWQRGYRLGWETIRAAPFRAVTQAFRKITYFFALETDGVLWNLKGFERAPQVFWTLLLLLVVNTAYIGMLGTGLLGLLSPPSPSAITTLFILLSTYLIIITIAFLGDPRYHFPLVPFMLLFSSKGLLLLYDRQRSFGALHQGQIWGKRRMLKWAAAMLLLMLMMAGNVWLKYLEFLGYY